MTDKELLAIEALSNGGHDIRALQDFLRAERDARVLTVADGGRVRVNRHKLLRGSYERDRKREPRVWAELAGAGKHYDGMFGPLTENGTPQMFDEVGLRSAEFAGAFEKDAPPASIAQQSALCVLWLSTSLVRECPQGTAAVRRRLAEILLAHPVLLHPAFLCPVEALGSVGLVSLVHALAHVRGGALPRAADLDGVAPANAANAVNAGGTAQRQAQRLRDFALHPCVTRGLGSSVLLLSSSAKKRRRRSCALPGIPSVMGGSISGMTGFVRSVMALDDALDDALDGVHGARERKATNRTGSKAVDRAFSTTLPLKPRTGPVLTMWRKNIGAHVVELFYQACERQSPVGDAASALVEVDSETLMALRRRSAHFGAEFQPERASLFSMVFGPRFAERTTAGVTSATAEICKALVVARLPVTDPLSGRLQQPSDMGPQSHALAARFLLDACVRASGASVGVPLAGAEVEEVLAFFKAVEELGGFDQADQADGSASEFIARLRGATQNVNFLRALDVFWAAREMTRVIEESLEVNASTLAASGSSASEVPASPSSPPAPRAARRLQL